MTGATREFAGITNATLRSRDGVECPVEMSVSRLKKGQDVVKGMVLVFRDITERRRAMQEIRQQASRAEALVEVASRLNKQIELDALLETVCITTNRALNAAGTAVFLLDRNADMLHNRAAYSDVVLLRAFAGTPFSFQRRVLDNLVSREQPIRVIRDPRAVTGIPYVDLLAKLRIGALVVAALFQHDNFLGAIVCVFADTQAPIGDDDVSLLTGLADQASSAIANAELFEQVRAGRERQRVLAKSLVEVQESERRHVARELHDQLGQALTGLQFMLEGAKSRAEEPQKGSLDELQEYVSDIMEQTREISLRLRPSMLDDLGLLPTLQWHFERYTRHTGIQVLFHESGDGERCPAEIETAAFRIIQEAMTNVARYAQVLEVAVSLEIAPNTLMLEVCDQGKGFEPAQAFNKPTSGLGGMRERAGLVGGYLTVHSKPGEGTRIVAALPLKGQTLERRKHDRDRAASG
jgi:signal transduction histidine kinase